MTRSTQRRIAGRLVCLVCAPLVACGQPQGVVPDEPDLTTTVSSTDGDLAFDTADDPSLDFSVVLEPWTGDYEAMVARRIVRILVPYSMTHYFLDGATERGIVAAAGRELEAEINRREGLATGTVRVVFVPTPRGDLISKLTSGLGDIAAGALGVTESRRAVVDFSEPVFRSADLVLCTGPGSPTLASIEDLAGRTVYIQPSGGHDEALEALSERLQADGRDPIEVAALDDRLEVDEILELVQAGLLPATVVFRPLADFWAQVFPDLTVHADLVVGAPRDVAWAFRPDSPQLAEIVNTFVTPRRHRTKYGNILFRRYLQNTTWVENADATADRQRFDRARPLFDRYGEQYELDPLLLMSVAYQESRLDQNVRSPLGAIGVMQVMPTTARSLDVGDVTGLEPNIHAGTRYLRQLVDRFRGPDLDDLNARLFALAAYNAGYPRIQRLQASAAEEGLDPSLWFDNVELLSARTIGRVNVSYVRNIYKYYLTYRLVEQRRAERGDRRGASRRD